MTIHYRHYSITTLMITKMCKHVLAICISDFQYLRIEMLF